MQFTLFSLLLLTSFTRTYSSTCPSVHAKAPVFISLNLVANRNRQLSALTHPAVSKHPEPEPASLWTTLKTEKWRILTWFCATCWCCTQSYVKYLERQISNKQCWSAWQTEKPVEQLYSMPREALIQNLSSELADRYGTRQQAVIRFVKQLELEESYLTRYRSLTGWLTRLWVSPIILV